MAHELSFHDLLEFIADERNIDLRGYKPTPLQRRLHKRMAQVKAAGYGDYRQLLRQNPGEITQLLHTVLIKVTDFFRDAPAWNFLRATVLPEVLGQCQAGEPLRAWSAGCATGQEAYSLAICLCEALGERLPQFDVKVYATDIDENALAVARRGEYHVDQLRRMTPELRERYFTPAEGKRMRVNRELRRMVIFGKSNAIHDAPISRIVVLLCRNMMIYFDSETQVHVLKRFHYALHPGGVLFLGKAESLLLHPELFTPLHSKWRIFKKVKTDDERRPPPRNVRAAALARDRTREELMILQEYYQSILDTVGQSIVVLGQDGKIMTANAATPKVWRLSGPVTVGTPLVQSPIARACPELLRKIEDAHQRRTMVEFECKLPGENGPTVLSLRVRPVFTPEDKLAGTVLYAEDVSRREHLERTVAVSKGGRSPHEELETTKEELQSTNEELETTNEELQSTNEELETMNEELQSTNEELETTNEELQSLNEELETMNEELRVRSEEMDQLNSRYVETLERIPFPVMLLSEQLKIEFWNTLAMKLFGFKSRPAVQLDLEQLPLPESARRVFKRKSRLALRKKGMVTAISESLRLDGHGTANLQFTPVSPGAAGNVLVIISPGPAAAGDGSRTKSGAARRVKKKKSAARRRSR